MNNETLRKAQQNARMNNCVRSRECRTWRFRDSNFQKIFRGSMPPHPPHIIRAFGANSSLVSPVTLVLNVQFQNKFHTWTKRMIIQSLDENRSLNTKETIQSETKLPLRESLSQYSSMLRHGLILGLDPPAKIKLFFFYGHAF